MMEKKQPLQQKILGKLVTVCKKLKLDPCISPHININSKWTMDLNIRPQTLKLIQESVVNTLELVGIAKNFLNGTPAAQHR
jgi:hypothetical protein